MARFLHTADLQLGMPFHWLEEGSRAEANRARLEAVVTIGTLARERDVEFVLVAGDLFDANTVANSVIVQACDRLEAIGREVWVLPGNHDHGGADSVYRSPRFERLKPDNVHVLLDTEPLLIGGDSTVLLPAPLLRRHMHEDPTRHISRESGRALNPDAVRIGLAHGSVRDFDGGKSGSMNRLDPELPSTTDLDYLALGDWHGLYKVNERAWYAGAPEPTSFTNNDPGYVLIVDVPERGASPSVEAVQVARTRWIRHKATLHSAGDLAVLQRFFDELPDKAETLVRLELEGVLSLSDCVRLEQVLGDAEARLLHLRRRGGGVLPAPTSDELSSIAGEGYVRAAVEQLRRQSEGSPIDDPQRVTAVRALQLLYRLRNR